MSIPATVNAELVRLKLEPLAGDQLACLEDPERLEEAAGMLSDLRDRCGVRLPLPRGTTIGGPFTGLDVARGCAEKNSHLHPAVTVDEMATDESRNTGMGNEFYVTAFDGGHAALALAESHLWLALWLHGVEQVHT